MPVLKLNHVSKRGHWWYVHDKAKQKKHMHTVQSGWIVNNTCNVADYNPLKEGKQPVERSVHCTLYDWRSIPQQTYIDGSVLDCSISIALAIILEKKIGAQWRDEQHTFSSIVPQQHYIPMLLTVFGHFKKGMGIVKIRYAPLGTNITMYTAILFPKTI